MSRFINTTIFVSLLMLMGFLLLPKTVAALDPCDYRCIDGLEPNMLITSDDHPAVYYYTENHTRRPYPTGEIYGTYYGHYGFVETFTTEEIEKIPLGEPMPPKVGSLMLKFPFNPATYYVDYDQTLRRIADEEVARAIYGADWAQKIVHLPEVYSLFYKKGPDVDSDEHVQVIVRYMDDLIGADVRIEIEGEDVFDVYSAPFVREFSYVQPEEDSEVWDETDFFIYRLPSSVEHINVEIDIRENNAIAARGIIQLDEMPELDELDGAKGLEITISQNEIKYDYLSPAFDVAE